MTGVLPKFTQTGVRYAILREVFCLILTAYAAVWTGIFFIGLGEITVYIFRTQRLLKLIIYQSQSITFQTA